jgi:hypothetical protein
MKVFIIGIILIVIFILGGIIGIISYNLGFSNDNKIVPFKAGTISQLSREDNSKRNPNDKFKDLKTQNEYLLQEVSRLKSDYEQMKTDYEKLLAEAKNNQAAVEHNKQNISEQAGQNDSSELDVKPTKKSPFAQGIRTQIGKQFKERIKKLNEKGYLSLYQQEEINKLTDVWVEELARLSEAFLTGEDIQEALKKNQEAGAQYEQKLKDILTPQQYSIYQEILKEEANEQIAQTIKMYMNGTVGMKGISESLGLSDEQKQKVQGMFEEKFKNYKPETPQVKTPQLPFDDKEFIEKVRNILTPEQYPKFDGYLKEQEAIKKMLEEFMPKENNKK